MALEPEARDENGRAFGAEGVAGAEASGWWGAGGGGNRFEKVAVPWRALYPILKMGCFVL